MHGSPLCPLDGRYSGGHTAQPLFSESAQHRTRWRVELYWLMSLQRALPGRMGADDCAKIHRLANEGFGSEEEEAVRIWERRTRHDVKALEMAVRASLDKVGLGHLAHLVHLGLTSEDVTSLSWMTSLGEWWGNFTTQLDGFRSSLERVGRLASGVMMGRTHGQPAAPTTMSHELEVFDSRLERLAYHAAAPLMAKWGGAVGTTAALEAAVPTYDWEDHCSRFVSEFPPGGLVRDPVTTQIGGRDALAERLHLLVRVGNVLTDLCQDLWQYCSMDYFGMARAPGQVGSSTMPQKVNPVPFEMAEGNFGLSNAMLTFMADKLCRSRMQRDLSDSTVMRSLGCALAYSEVALWSLTAGLERLEFRQKLVESEADGHWEMMSEVVQTLMRVRGDPDAYEKVRVATQGLRGVSRGEFWLALDGVAPADLTGLVMSDALGGAGRGWGCPFRPFERNGQEREDERGSKLGPADPA